MISMLISTTQLLAKIEGYQESQVFRNVEKVIKKVNLMRFVMLADHVGYGYYRRPCISELIFLTFVSNRLVRFLQPLPVQ